MKMKKYYANCDCGVNYVAHLLEDESMCKYTF